MNKEDKIIKKYESLTEKFNPNSEINIPEILAIPIEGYSIKDLKDIEGKSKMFALVKKMNLSDNFISRVRLREFNSIEELNVSKNMVGEVILNMTNLKVLNLSYNLLGKIFDLSDLPNLITLNLSYNVIQNLSIKDLISVKKNLVDLDVSYNKIKFKSFEFISFFEGLKNFKLKKINLKENAFNTNSRLKEIYKIFGSLCLPDLEMIDMEMYNINPNVVDINDIMKQILREESDKNCYDIIQNYEKIAREYLINNKLNNNQNVQKYNKNENEIIYEKKSTTKKDLLSIIRSIIKNLDDIYICKYDFQFIYLEIIQDIMNILSKNYIYNNNNVNEEEVQKLFPSLLNGLYTFIENNDEKEEFTIFKMIAYLAFIEKGAFSNVCFDFFKSIMISSNSKSQYIGTVIKTVFSERLDEIIEWENFSILKEISEFFDENLQINIDDIFDGKINKFIDIFIQLWKEDEDSNDDSSENNNPEIDENSCGSDNTENNESSIKTDLQITSLKITKRYFQIKVKQMKENSYIEKNQFAVAVTVLGNENKKDEEKEKSFNENLIEKSNLNLSDKFTQNNDIPLNEVSENESICNSTEKKNKFGEDLKKSFYKIRAKLEESRISNGDSNSISNKESKSIKNLNTEVNEKNNPEVTIPDDKRNSLNDIKINKNFLNLNFQGKEEENSFTRIIKKKENSINNDDNKPFTKYKNSRLDNEYFDESKDKGGKNIIVANNDSYKSKFLNPSNLILEESNKLLIGSIEEDKNINFKGNSGRVGNLKKKKETINSGEGEDSDNSENSINLVKKINSDHSHISTYKDESQDSQEIYNHINSLLDPDKNPNLNRNNRNQVEVENSKQLQMKNFRRLFFTIFKHIQNKLKDFSYFLTKEHINLLNAFLDFCTFFFLNIHELIDNEILCSKLELNEEVPTFFKSDEIMDYLKSLIVEIVKKIKIEELIEDDFFDNKFVTNFKNYFINPKNIHPKKLKQNEVVTLFRDLIQFKELYVNIVKCFATTICLLEPDKILNNLNDEIARKILNVLKKPTFIDPYILDASISFFLILMSNEKVKNDYILFINLIEKKNKFSNLKNLLNLIDNESKTFQEFVYFLYTRILPKKIAPNQIDYNQIDNRISGYMKNIIKKVIYVFKKISKFMLLKNPLIIKAAKEPISYLRDNKLNKFLGNCLKFEDDDIRLSAIKTIYYGNTDNLDIRIIDDIMEIVSSYDSITEGKTEFILSIVYLLFNKILCNQISTTHVIPQKFINALIKAFEFLEKNLNRDPKEIEEIEQKNELAISLLLYITTISKYKFSEEDYQKQINKVKNREYFYLALENDFFYYENSFYIPIEFERTLLGNKINSFTEITKRNPTIDPYSYSFLRIIIKMADILCDLQDYSLNYSFDIKSKQIITNLMYYINRRFVFRIFNESLSWGDFIFNLDQKIIEYKTVKKFHKLNKKRDERLLKKTHEKLNIFKMNSLILKTWRRKISENMETVSDSTNLKELLIKGMDKIKEILAIKQEKPTKKERKMNKEEMHTIREEENDNEENDEINPNMEEDREKYFVLDYLNVVYKKVYKKIHKLDNNDNTIIPIQNKYDESNQNINLFEQIDFIVFFPNLLNMLLGKSLNAPRQDINSNLINKFDKNILEVIKMFKNVTKLSDLKNLNVFSSTNKLKMFEIKNYVKKNYIDKDEEKYINNKRGNQVKKENENFKDLKDIIKSSFEKKINLSENNYKEDYFVNCLNFNKRIYSNNFNKRTVANIYWKNEVLSTTQFKNMNRVTRSRVYENENNSQLRSLLISTLLRCLKPILQSKSKNITKKFLEILFSEKIYYDFFLLISSGLYLKFNIGHKILDTICFIFNDNFYYVKNHFEKLFFPDNNNNKQSYMSSSNKNKKNYHHQINKFDKLGTEINENEFKYYAKILEIINLGSIFLNKIYYICYLKKNFHYSANHLFVKSFTCALNAILTTIINSNLLESFNESLETFVTSNFLQNSMLKNLLPFLSTIYNLNMKVNKLMYKKTLFKNFVFDHFGTKANQIDLEIFLHLLKFKFYLMKCKGVLINLIAAIRFLCRDNKNIFLKELITLDYKNYNRAVRYKFNNKNKENVRKLKNQKDFYTYEEKIGNINFMESNTNSTTTPDDNLNEEEEKVNLQTKDEIDMPKIRGAIINEIFSREKLFKICNKLQLEYLNGENIIYKSITYYNLINTKENSLGIVIVTHLNFYIFRILNKPFHELNEYRLDTEKPYLRFNLDEISQLKYFDYYSRVVLIGQKNMKYKHHLNKSDKEEFEKAENNLAEKDTKKEDDIVIEENNEKDKELDNPVDLDVADLNKELENANENYNPDESAAPHDSFDSSNNTGNSGFFNAIEFKKKEIIHEKMVISLSLNSISDALRLMKKINSQNHRIKLDDIRYNFIEYIVLIYEKNNVNKKINKHKRLVNIPDMMTEFSNSEDIPILLNNLFKNEELDFIQKEYNMKSVNYKSDEIFTKLISNLKTFNIICEFEQKGYFASVKKENLFKNEKILHLGKENLFILDENVNDMSIEYFLKEDKFYNAKNNSEIFPILLTFSFRDIVEITYDGEIIHVAYTAERRKKKIEMTVINSSEGEIIYLHLLNSYMHEGWNL